MIASSRPDGRNEPNGWRVPSRACLNEAAELGAQKAVERLEPRLDKQDATLRLMWKQMKGNGKLPIDD